MGFRDPDPCSKNRASSLGSFYSLTKSSQDIAPHPAPESHGAEMLQMVQQSRGSVTHLPAPSSGLSLASQGLSFLHCKSRHTLQVRCEHKKAALHSWGHGWWRLSLQEANDGSGSQAGNGQCLPTPSEGFPCSLCVLPGQLRAPQLSSGQGLQRWVGWGSGYREW